MSKKADDRVYKVKIQRPIFPPDAPFLAMSECGCIQPTLLQATPQLTGKYDDWVRITNEYWGATDYSSFSVGSM